MTYNPLDILRTAGVINSSTPPAALDVLSELTEAEASFISSLDARLKAALGPEVVAHSEEGDENTPCVIAFGGGPSAFE